MLKLCGQDGQASAATCSNKALTHSFRIETMVPGLIYFLHRQAPTDLLTSLVLHQNPALRPQHWIGLSPNSSPWSFENAPLLTGRQRQNDRMYEVTPDDLTLGSYERLENSKVNDSRSET